MSRASFVTSYTSSTDEAIKAAWKLKRITWVYETLAQRAISEFGHIMESRGTVSEALVTKYHERAQNLISEQSAALEDLRTELGISNDDWGGGYSWVVDLSHFCRREVMLVLDSDSNRVLIGSV